LALCSLQLVRLDLFLKLSRLYPSRSVAQKLCDAGFVLLNGRPVKSAHAVKVGDEITIRKPNEETIARVLSVPTSHNVSRRDAGSLVEIVRASAIQSPDLPIQA
jgi:ribosomal 50S subunit-recycling heat shock protein